MSACHKTIKEAMKVAGKHGFYLHRHGKHLIWRHPNGSQCTSPVSASDHRWLKNLNSQMRHLASGV